jgi:hypothetical protein
VREIHVLNLGAGIQSTFLYLERQSSINFSAECLGMCGL